jgi:hypothetical protein
MTIKEYFISMKDNEGVAKATLRRTEAEMGYSLIALRVQERETDSALIVSCLVLLCGAPLALNLFLFQNIIQNLFI